MLSRNKLVRGLFAVLIIALAASAVLPQSAAAMPTEQPARMPNQAVTLTFSVVGVKAGESITIRTTDFPIRTQFTIRMDVVGKQALNGLIVTEFNSGLGGVIETTLPIPESLRDELILAVRVESKDGYLATGWFINEDMAYKPLVSSGIKPQISFSNVKKNTTVTVEGKNLSPNAEFFVRVGPYYTFYRDYVYATSVTTDSSGSLKFDLPLASKSLQDADYILVRVDGGGIYTYNNFQNVDGGVSVPDAKLYKFEWCKVLYAQAVPALAPKEQFDAVWTIQNTSNQKWPVGHVAYKFIGGESLYKYKDFYSLGRDIANGEVFDVAVDMIAPSDPGWHNTKWSIYDARNSKVMCVLSMSVFVKEP